MKTQKINSLRAFIQEHCSLCSCVDIAVEFVPLKMHREKYVDALPATSHHIHNSFVVVVRWVAHFSGLLQGWWLLELNNNAICGGNYCVLKSFGISVRTTRQTAIEWLRTALCCVRSDSQFSIKFSWAKLFLLSYFASMLLFLLQPCKLCDFRCSTPFIVWRTKSKRKTKNKKQWMAIGKRKDSCGSRLLAKDADADAFHRWLAMHSPLRSNIVAVRTNNKNNTLLCLRRIYLQPKRDEENDKKENYKLQCNGVHSAQQCSQWAWPVPLCGVAFRSRWVLQMPKNAILFYFYTRIKSCLLWFETMNMDG